MSTYTEDHLVEQPAIHLMQHELGWEVVNCCDEWNEGVSNQWRDGKGEGVEILNVGFLILNGRGRDQAGPRLNPDLPVEAIEGAVKERLGAGRSGNGLRRDATATLCWTIGSICALRDSDIPCNWNL